MQKRAARTIKVAEQRNQRNWFAGGGSGWEMHTGTLRPHQRCWYRQLVFSSDSRTGWPSGYSGEQCIFGGQHTHGEWRQTFLATSSYSLGWGQWRRIAVRPLHIRDVIIFQLLICFRNHYICAVKAAQLMVPRKNGLIVNVSSIGGIMYLFGPAYGVGKAAVSTHNLLRNGRRATTSSLEGEQATVTFSTLTYFGHLLLSLAVCFSTWAILRGFRVLKCLIIVTLRSTNLLMWVQNG